MKDSYKTRQHLLDELREMRQRVTELEAEAGPNGSGAQSHFLAQLMDSVRESVVATDLEGHVIYWGKGAKLLYGYGAQEVMGKPVTFIVEPDEEEEEKERMHQVFETGMWSGEYLQKRKDGSKFWAETVISLVRDHHGKPSGFVGIDRDITERKRYEEKIRQSEGRYRTVVEESMQGILIHQDSIVQFVNQATASMFGHNTPDELIGRDVWTLIAPEEHKELRKRAADILCGNAVHVHDGWQAIRKDGTRVWIQSTGSCIYWQGQPAVLSFYIDATKRKLAEEALRASEEKYRLLVDNAHEGIVVIQDGVARFANAVVEEFSGYTLSELTSQPFVEFIHPEDRPMVVERHIKRLKGESVPNNYCFRVIWRDNRVRWVEIQSVVISWEGKPATLNFLRDITDRKTAQEALSHRLEIERIVTSISTEFINLAPEGIDRGVNEALCRIGEFAGVDRCYVFQIGGDGKEMNCTHEWCADGIEPQIEDLQKLQMEEFPWWSQRIQRLENIHIPRVTDLPSAANAERQLLQSQDIQSLIVVPLAHSEAAIGFLGFDSVKSEKSWSEEDIALLKMAGEIIVNALQRRRYYEALRSREKELESQAHNLEEVNVALRVLLEKREEDRKQIEQRMLSNFRKLIIPFLERLKSNNLNSKQRTYVEIIESNLNEIVSPLARTLSSKYSSLTPREIEMANLIKAGKTSKEIAELLSISPAVVNFHRQNLRKKLGLKSRDSNLRAFLFSIS
jgi:PAS domain S-box-containing protein